MLKVYIAKLEELLSDKLSYSYRNEISIMNKLYKIVKFSKYIDATLDTSILSLNSLSSLTSQINLSLASPGSVIAKKLSKLLSSCTKIKSPNKEKKEEETHTPKCDVEVSKTLSIQKGSKKLINDNQMCLQFLRQFKQDVLQTLFSSFEPADTNCLNQLSQDTITTVGQDVKENKTDESLNVNMLSKLDSTSSKQRNFVILESVPDSHVYKNSTSPNCPRLSARILKEINIFQSSLPSQIVVKTFEDRMDLLSVMIRGAKGTPYEYGLFFFDIQLPLSYPLVPPWLKYISYCSDRLNPNLYENGRVCVSLLGTWFGKEEETWNPNVSTLLQVLLSIQGLILVAEPYYNEEGLTKLKECNTDQEASRLYNEMVMVKMVQAMNKLYLSPNEVFREEIESHFKLYSRVFIERLEKWVKMSEYWNTHKNEVKKQFVEMVQEVFPEEQKSLPEFPLLPASLGFCISLKKSITNFRQSLNIF